MTKSLLVILPSAFLPAVALAVFLEEFAERRLSLVRPLDAGGTGALFDLCINTGGDATRLLDRHIGKSTECDPLGLTAFGPPKHRERFDATRGNPQLQARRPGVTIDCTTARWRSRKAVQGFLREVDLRFHRPDHLARSRWLYVQLGLRQGYIFGEIRCDFV